MTAGCVRCGAPLGGDARPIIGRCAEECCGPAPSPAKHGGFCSAVCERSGARRALASRRLCPQCRRPYSTARVRPDGTTGPADSGFEPWCSERCATQVLASRRRAVAELKADEFADGLEDLRAQLHRAVLLHEHWCGRGPDECTEPPPAGAKPALRERVDQLRERLEAAAHERAVAEQDDTRRARRERRREQAAQQERERQAWREAL